MSTYHGLPPFRNLDIYRLVVVRRLKQLDVAKSFSVDPSRISQVIRRVRDWVDDTVGDWLFPGCDDLRFYVALEVEKIRVLELPDNPEPVTLISPSRTYTRQPHQPDAPARANPASLLPTGSNPAEDLSPIPDIHSRLNMTPQPINSVSASASDPLATTPDATTDCLTPDMIQLGAHIAQILMRRKKHRNLSAVLKPRCPPRTSTRQTSTR